MWECSKCHETNDESFEVCWNCGTSKDGTEDPQFDALRDSSSDVTEVPTARIPDRPILRRCPDCDGPMHRIKLIDKTGEGSHHTDLEYVLPEGRRSILFGRFPIEGKIVASMCNDCGRILLNGVAS